MNILSIETSCDETAVAVLEIKGQNYKVLANLVSSQIEIHKKYGGVVPEVAARKHVENIMPLLGQALEQNKLKPQDIDAISVVYGPGLITALIIGIETAKTLAFAWDKPLIPINHIKAHILANWLKGEQGKLQKIKFPALCLVVSGGHTSLVLLQGVDKMKIIGQTRDDAVGEAFDKVAKLMDLGYPGGPIISQLAKKGNPQAFALPRPMLKDKNYDFSFSGLKTAVRYELEKVKKINQQIKTDMAASFQQACIEVLIAKTIRAAQEFKVKSVLLGGGVSANKELRQQLELEVNKFENFKFYQPDLSLTTDNALMVAIAGYWEYAEKNGLKEGWQKVKVDPNATI